MGAFFCCNLRVGMVYYDQAKEEVTRMQEEMVFHNEEEYLEYVRQALEESEREAADPDTKWMTWEESMREGDALLRELERRGAAKSA